MEKGSVGADAQEQCSGRQNRQLKEDLFLQNIMLGKEVEQDVLKHIRNFFLTDREEEISEFKASLYLEFILKEIGPYIYNQALEDAHTLLLEKVEDLYGLEKRAR